MFLVNGIYGIAAGTWALIGCTLISLVATLWMLGRPPIMPFIAGAVSVTFGTMTLITGDAMWVQIKVTLFNALVALLLWVGMRTGHNFFKFVFGKTFGYTEEGGPSSPQRGVVLPGYGHRQRSCAAGLRPRAHRGAQSRLHRHRYLDPVQDLHHHAGDGVFFWWQVRLLQKYRLPEPVAARDPA
jgi:hypothetical protein